MFAKLEEVEKSFERVQMDLQNPDLINDQEKYKAMMMSFAELEEIVIPYREYKKNKQDLADNKALLESEDDEELRALAKEEIGPLETAIEELEAKLKILLLPKDPRDGKNVILEVRAGAGGDEASLFADELFRAYSNYASAQGWSVQMLSMSEGNAGGVKEVVASISGEKVYSRMKYESGVHRVQRVPKTESQGRIHTSTVTVAVVPEADEVDVKIDPKEIRIDVMRASGAGGQHINTTDSAVRITHLPTNIVVYCQQEKSQHKNKDKAMKILYSRLLDLEEEKKREEASDLRVAQIGTGDRSERIRTYNFPQTRVTDHRIGLTIHSLGEIMNGDMETVIAPVIAHYQAEQMQQQNQAT